LRPTKGEPEHKVTDVILAAFGISVDTRCPSGGQRKILPKPRLDDGLDLFGCAIADVGSLNVGKD
jgi:hypothetical protein